MSIQSDIVTALASVAGGRVYPEAAPEDAALPFVIYRRTLYEPVMTLTGYAGATRSAFMFECWATTKAVALSTAAAVQSAIEAAAPITTKYREPASGEDFEPASDQYVEPVAYTFWHA